MREGPIYLFVTRGRLNWELICETGRVELTNNHGPIGELSLSAESDILLVNGPAPRKTDTYLLSSFAPFPLG